MPPLLPVAGRSFGTRSAACMTQSPMMASSAATLSPHQTTATPGACSATAGWLAAEMAHSVPAYWGCGAWPASCLTHAMQHRRLCITACLYAEPSALLLPLHSWVTGAGVGAYQLRVGQPPGSTQPLVALEEHVGHSQEEVDVVLVEAQPNDPAVPDGKVLARIGGELQLFRSSSTTTCEHACYF